MSLAASSIEITETVTVTPQAAPLVNIGGAEGARPAAKASWGAVETEQELHMRAQRFARTQVAQLLLHKVKRYEADVHPTICMER